MELPESVTHVGEWLKEGRRMLNLTQTEMANKIDVHQGTYSRWERTNYAPPREKLVQIARLVAEKYAQPETVHNELAKMQSGDNTSINNIYINFIYLYSLILDINTRLDILLKRRKMHNLEGEICTPDPDLESLVRYFYERYEAEKGVAPSKHKKTDMAVMKQAKVAGDYSTEAMRQCIYTFLHYKGRTRCRINDFAAAVDNVYLFIKDKAEGKR